MRPAELLKRCAAQGVTVRRHRTQPDMLGVLPPEKLTPAMRALLLRHKAKLLQHLCDRETAELLDRARAELRWTDADVAAFMQDDIPRGGATWALTALGELLDFVQRERAGRREVAR